VAEGFERGATPDSGYRRAGGQSCELTGQEAQSDDRVSCLFCRGAQAPNGLLRAECRLRLVAPATFDDLFSPAREPTGPDDYLATYRRVPLSEWQFLLATPTMGIREFRPDLVHIDYDPWSAIFWQTRIITALFARGTPVISGAKKNTFRRLPGIIGTVKRWLARCGIRITTRIEAASNMTAKMYQREFGVRPDRISVVTHAGVDTNLFEPCDRPPSDSDWLVVGYCGQFSEHKGVLTLFEATKLARSRGVRVRLEMLGKGPMRSALLESGRDSPWLPEIGIPFRRIGVLYVVSADSLLVPKPTKRSRDPGGCSVSRGRWAERGLQSEVTAVIGSVRSAFGGRIRTPRCSPAFAAHRVGGLPGAGLGHRGAPAGQYA
jgi:hypothetical protein